MADNGGASSAGLPESPDGAAAVDANQERPTSAETAIRHDSSAVRCETRMCTGSQTTLETEHRHVGLNADIETMAGTSKTEGDLHWVSHSKPFIPMGDEEIDMFCQLSQKAILDSSMLSEFADCIYKRGLSTHCFGRNAAIIFSKMWQMEQEGRRLRYFVFKMVLKDMRKIKLRNLQHVKQDCRLELGLFNFLCHLYAIGRESCGQRINAFVDDILYLSNCILRNGDPDTKDRGFEYLVVHLLKVGPHLDLERPAALIDLMNAVFDSAATDPTLPESRRIQLQSLVDVYDSHWEGADSHLEQLLEGLPA